MVSSALETDYEVLEEIGRGGMAVVYRAREKELDREVAIKVLPSVLSFDAGFVERFQREAKTAAQLEHPSIVPIYRVGKSGNVIFFVMKLLRGQNLSAVLRERPKLTVDEVRRVLMDTASATSSPTIFCWTTTGAASSPTSASRKRQAVPLPPPARRWERRGT